MANTIHVDVVSAEEQIFSGEAEFVVLPGMTGELGIYPRHTPLLTQIKPGAVRIKVPGAGEEELVFVQGGFLEVQPHARDGARRHRDPREGPRRSQGARGQAARPRKRCRTRRRKEEIAHGRSRARRRAGAARGDPQAAAPRVTTSGAAHLTRAAARCPCCLPASYHRGRLGESSRPCISGIMLHCSITCSCRGFRNGQT